jgi:ribonuclease VapC
VILDSSAIVGILLREPAWEGLLAKVASAKTLGAGTPTLAESAIVLAAKLRSDARGLLNLFLTEAGIVAIPFGEEHWRAAAEAYRRFGRGKHKASLNFGDCLAYAVAKLAGQPLLCTGRDFAATDLELA